ncbi:MAG: oxidoreductase [Phycisphaeraceae bacterium]|nr:MAG: oxidoreductase [Phycisphaeraceae bacterium]
MIEPMAWCILAPFIGASLAFLLPGRVWRRPIAIGAIGATLASVWMLTSQVWNSGAQRMDLSGWPAPLGIGLAADGFSVFMIVMTGVVGSLIGAYALWHYSDLSDATEPAERRLFWPLWLILWGSLNAIYLSSDIFNIYVALEVITLAAVALITLSGKAEALVAAMRYLLAAFLGSLSYLMGVALLYATHGALDLVIIADQERAGLPEVGAFALMATGLALKTALFPMHFWLPPAHSKAAAPVSAILSALVVKASFYVLLRLWFGVFDGPAMYAVGILLGTLGSAAIIWGAFQALRQMSLKLLIAHSTVAQIGYLFLIFPLTARRPSGELAAAGWITEACTGVSYHALSHALAKAAMFLGAGVVLHVYGSDLLTNMRGMSRRLPITTFALAIAGVSLMGLPPSGGFAAKWLIVTAALGAGQWWWVLVILIGGLLTAGYIFLMLRWAFISEDAPIQLRPANMPIQLAALALALLSVLVGFRLEEPFQLLVIGDPFPIFDLP